jgi:hypothetical protein
MAQLLAAKLIFPTQLTGLINLGECGVRVRVLMALAGHSNMATTLR